MAGGTSSDGFLTHTEIYNTRTQEWREGPTLPQPICCMASVQYEDTFLLVGGDINSAEELDTIYQYNQTSETWTLRPERLSTPKVLWLGAVLAGPPAAECN